MNYTYTHKHVYIHTNTYISTYSHIYGNDSHQTIIASRVVALNKLIREYILNLNKIMNY
jgi:hypothetical protein